jgi:putative ABC transport system permease protein
MALKELMKNKGFALFFILNLSLGLAGFIAIHSFGSSLNRHLDENLKEILTADLVLIANSPLIPEELALVDEVLGKDKIHARLINFFTMVKTRGNARLIRVMAIDDKYPLYGTFSLEGQSQKKDIQKRPGVFMTRDTADALGIRNKADVNTPLVLGNKTFSINNTFAKYSQYCKLKINRMQLTSIK